jgi:hypothetical protein
MGLAKGILKKWTKGFSCPGVEGEDVVALLRAAIHRRNDVQIDVAALLNDTTGWILSREILPPLTLRTPPLLFPHARFCQIPVPARFWEG